MKQTWQDILHKLTTGRLTGDETVDIAGKLELMLVRLQAEPCGDQADLASRCIAAVTWSTLDQPMNDVQISCIIRLGRIFNHLADVDHAEICFHQAVTLGKIHSQQRLQAVAHMELGELARRRGRLTVARYHQTQALDIGASEGLDREQADARNNLANIAIESGDLDKAETLLAESLDIAERIGETRLEGHIYNNLGVINCLRGRFAEAISDYSRALPKREQAEDEKGMSETYHNMGLAYLDSGDLDRAAVFTQKALDKAQEIKDSGQETHILLTLTELTSHKEDYLYALSMADQLTHRQERLGDRPGLAETKKLVGTILLKQGILNQAETALSAAMTMFRSLGLLPGEAESMKTLGLCFSRQGRNHESLEVWKKARALFQNLGNLNETNEIDALMKGTA